jgi:hypothetical protein
MMMAEKIQKLNKGLLSFLGTILILIPALSLAIDATLYGEVTDDGGDPNLLVWFEYGKNSNLGYQTQTQKKYGIGEFTATISNLESCKTYYYRACVKHENQNDTSCGEIKTFTTKCEGPSVDLKVNGRDDSITVDEGASVTLSWNSFNANRCEASGDWSGSKAVFGSETISNLTFGTKTFILTCYGEGGSAQDSVSVFVRKVLGIQTPIVEKLVRNLSQGTIFQRTVSANPGDVLEFQIRIFANSEMKNVRVKDEIPEKMRIRENSLKVNGTPFPGNLREGINLGDLKKGETKIISFVVDLASQESFGYGKTDLTNTAKVYFDGGEATGECVVSVLKREVLASATKVQTGLVDNVFFSLFVPLIFAISLIFAFKEKILKFEEFLEKRKTEYRVFKAQKALNSKIKEHHLKKWLQ